MTGKENFTQLLESYLEGNTTTEQLEELMMLIKSGEYDELLKVSIYNAMLNHRSDENFDHSRAEEMLQRILGAEKQTAKLIPVHKPFAKKLRWIIAAAAVIIVLLSVWLLSPYKKKSVVDVAVNNNKSVQEIPANKQEKQYVRLQDGSTVLLNKGSHIEYPDKFTGKTREVTLIGEAYFDIYHDSERPFIVHTSHVTTRVLGTAFNIKAYPGEKSITVTVTRGKVQVSDNNKSVGIITPNESISVNTENKSFKQEKVDAEQVIEWKKQYLVLDDISFENAAVLIEAKYHVKISFLKETVKQCHLSATFMNNESLEQVLTVLTNVVNATYEIQPNDQVIINGEGCK